jgi:hypothetical protein
MATLTQVRVRDQSFWQKMMLGLALFILFGFAQFGARGMVDYRAAPPFLHAHALVMVAWLSLTVAQATFVARDNMAMHRRLGWLGTVLAALVVGMGLYVSTMVLRAHKEPFFFTRPYFLALNEVSLLVFGGLVAAAIARRRDTEWHRRLLVGTMIVLMEPALGRLLPMPLIMPYGEWVTLAIQLAVIAIVARHDRRLVGAVHPATKAVALVVVLTHCVIELMAISPVWIGWTTRFVGA